MSAHVFDLPRHWGRVTEWSLRRRLMLLVSAGTVLAWLVGGAVVLLATQRETERLHVTRLKDFSRIVLRFAEHEIEEILAERPGEIIHIETAVTLDPRFQYQVRNARGQLVLVSAETTRDPFVPLDSDGHQAVAINGAEHFVYSQWNGDRSLKIHVAERASERSAVMMSVGVELLAFFVLTVVALLLLNRWLIGRATHALDQAAEELVRRSPGDLKPIETENPPRELVPLLRAINCLFARVGQAMATERTFSTNAAHELRTPLAAVRIQAQVAERARSSSGTHEALEQLGVCVDRASRMVDQLLMLARVGSSPIAASTMSLVDMDRLVGQVVAELGPMFAQHKIGIETRLEPAKVFGLEFALASMVRNLLENAARYTPDGGVVRVETLQEGRSTCIVVEDSGPGISVEERERVFEPFYRIPTEGVEGCGIGLSIVRSVVGVHHGQIRLAEAVLGGLRVTVRLPSDGVVNSRLSS